MAVRVYADALRIIPVNFTSGELASDLVTCLAPVSSEFAQDAAGYMQVQAIDTPISWLACSLTFEIFRSPPDTIARPLYLCDGSDVARLTIPTVVAEGTYELLPFWFYAVTYFRMTRDIDTGDQTVSIVMQPLNQVPA